MYFEHMFVQCTVKNHLLLFFCLSLSSPISYIMIWKLNTYMKGIDDKNSSRQKDPVRAGHGFQKVVAHAKPAVK